MLAGHALVALLYGCGHRVLYGVPGESYLPVLDGLASFKDFEYITCRHEGGASFMACASARLTGKPALLAVTRGPGLANASIGIHTAAQDALPLLVLVGLSERTTTQRRAFQEVDLQKDWAGVAKHAFIVTDARRLTELVRQGLSIAISGRPGPVLLGLPEDMLYDEVAAPDDIAPVTPAAGCALETIRHIADLLQKAQSPMIVVAGGVWSQHAADSIANIAHRLDVPMATGFRCQDYLDNQHSKYVGDVGIGINPDLEKALTDADLILALGGLDDPTTDGYQRARTAQLLEVVPDLREAAYSYARSEIIEASPPALAALLDSNMASVQPRAESARTKMLRSSYLAIRNASLPNSGTVADALRLIQEHQPSSIVVNGSGNYAGFVRRNYQFREFGTQLAPRSGAMGYGVPAAIAASHLSRRPIISINGDGCFLMNANEMASMRVAHGPILFLVINNGGYGTIAGYQKKLFPERQRVGIDLDNPNFATYAHAFGIPGVQLPPNRQLLDAVTQWCASPRHSLIEVVMDPT